MNRIITQVLMVTVILSSVAVSNGCEIHGRYVPHKDISGPLFKREIGCSIYLIWNPPWEKEGLKKYLYPLDELYKINASGSLERVYIPDVETQPKDFHLTDYGYPIVVQEFINYIGIYQADGEKRVLEFDRYIDVDVVSKDGNKALLQATKVEDDNLETEYRIIDLGSGETLWSGEVSLEKYWSWEGANLPFDKFLIMKEVSQGSYSRERRSWWEPYVFSINDSEQPVKKIEFPGSGVKGTNQVVMLRDSGNLIGIVDNNEYAEFYKTLSPYSEFELIQKVKLPFPDILGVTRDSSRVLLSWKADDKSRHLGVFNLVSGEMKEISYESGEDRYSSVYLSPGGDRIVLFTTIGRKIRETKYVFSVYDVSTGELIDTVEWPVEGSISHVTVGE